MAAATRRDTGSYRDEDEEEEDVEVVMMLMMGIGKYVGGVDGGGVVAVVNKEGRREE